MDWSDWVPFPLIRGLVKHTIGALACVLAFYLAKLVIVRVMPASWVKDFILFADDCGIVAVFVWLLLQLFHELWESLSWRSGTHLAAI
jgi:uncharacterized membrane protein required for colicin V production